jgi:hypothetical protein
MRCRWCDSEAIKFEPNPVEGRRWNYGDEVPDNLKGIAFCVDHLLKYSVPRQIGMRAAIKYLKKRGKINAAMC